MTKAQRKKHLLAWSILLILLPVGILLSWLVIPNQQPVKLLEADNTDPLPVIEQTVDLPGYSIHLRKDEHSKEKQIEWINKKVLNVPSAVIYQARDTAFDIAKSKLIGRIETSGKYLFPVELSNETGRQFILYDFIHQVVIDRFHFNP